jgi:hypothetical protein
MKAPGREELAQGLGVDPWNRRVDADTAPEAVLAFTSLYDVQKWLPVLGAHTFRTELVPLTRDEMEAMRRSFAKEADREEKKVLDRLAQRLDSAMRVFGSKGCFVRLSSRSPKDAVTRSPAFVAMMAKRLASVADDDWNGIGTAFYECVVDASQVGSGRDAVALFCDSSRVFQDVRHELAATSRPSELSVVLREFVKLECSCEMRLFVVCGRITAASQYLDCLHFEHLHADSLRERLLAFEADVLARLCPSLPDAFVCDVALLPGEVKIIELNPFYHKTGTCLFNWDADEEILLRGACVIRLASRDHALLEAEKEFGDLKETIRAAAERQKSNACVVA